MKKQYQNCVFINLINKLQSVYCQRLVCLNSDDVNFHNWT